MKPYLFLLVICCFGFQVQGQTTLQTDVCIYGATSGGVMAAYTAKKAGKSVLLIEPGNRLGGLTSGGLGYTDIGNKYAISGLALDFYRQIGRHYGKFEQWIFEPRVAENLFREYLREAKVEWVPQYRLVSVKKENGVIQEIVLEHSEHPSVTTRRVVRAKMFIDCSYEGDLMAQAGVSYFVGREANSVYQETYNGVQLLDKHQFPDGIDPYKVKGDPSSGLLWGISEEPLAEQGSGDKKVQAYNFRICLTNDPANQIPITEPEDYDADRYELLLRLLEKEPNRPFHMLLKPDMMPNQKTDINNNGPISTDMIGMNYDYPEADYDTRKRIQKAHENYVKGFLYFIGNDPRMPERLRTEMKKWGYPKDEYTDTGHWSPQMYVREARRMIGEYVMTQANCEGRATVTDGVGMAAYTMDSHNCQRIVIEKNGVKMVKNEGDVQIGGFPPYPIAYRSLIPKASECKNLLVPVCLSASHIAYGSIRMEPVFMVLSQSAALAAVMAIDGRSSVQDIDVKKLQAWLKKDPLMNGSQPDIVVDDADAEGVVVNGEWTTEKRGGYGPSLHVDRSKGQSAKSLRFSPSLPKAGKYRIYTYFPRVREATSQTSFTVFDGRQEQQIILKTADIRIEGQTSGEWVMVGVFQLPKGRKSYLEVSNKNADGAVVADAVMWVKE